MLKPIYQYAKDEAWPRWRKIVLTPETLISVGIVVLFWKFGAALFAEYPKISDITTGLIAYASIAMGFCVAGLTISLTLPEPRFTLQLSSEQNQKPSHYSDLLFVFSWTAIAHWCAVLILFAVILLADGSKTLLPAGHSGFRTAVVAVVSGICVYCFCQFLITLITLSQVGHVYIKFLRSKQA